MMYDRSMITVIIIAVSLAVERAKFFLYLVAIFFLLIKTGNPGIVYKPIVRGPIQNSIRACSDMLSHV